jgi:hypothetical protein
MKTGRRSRGGSGARRARRTSGTLAAVAVLLVAGLLVFMAGGCGEKEGTPTSDLSTASTGGTTDTSGGGSTDDSLSEAPGTRRDPIPLGQKALVGDWEVLVSDATLDATQAILDENMFNDPPDAESQYVLLTLEATYRGLDPSTFWIDMLYYFVGDEGDTFGMAEAVTPDSITNDGETAKGGSISGNVCFLVASKQVSGGTLMLEEAFAWEEGRVFFAVE